MDSKNYMKVVVGTIRSLLCDLKLQTLRRFVSSSSDGPVLSGLAPAARAVSSLEAAGGGGGGPSAPSRCSATQSHRGLQPPQCRTAQCATQLGDRQALQ